MEKRKPTHFSSRLGRETLLVFLRRTLRYYELPPRGAILTLSTSSSILLVSGTSGALGTVTIIGVRVRPRVPMEAVLTTWGCVGGPERHTDTSQRRQQAGVDICFLNWKLRPCFFLDLLQKKKTLGDHLTQRWANVLTDGCSALVTQLIRDKNALWDM